MKQTGIEPMFLLDEVHATFEQVKQTAIANAAASPSSLSESIDERPIKKINVTSV
jgi:recombinational DNA repair ATPase RecF